jgi:hypothetical protein
VETIINWKMDVTKIEMGTGLKEKDKSKTDSARVVHFKHCM